MTTELTKGVKGGCQGKELWRVGRIGQKTAYLIINLPANSGLLSYMHK